MFHQFGFLFLMAVVCVTIDGCGGGGADGGAPSDAHEMAVIRPVPLRKCETTGPTAPPCSASEAAGGVQ
jgi:hypothetical protein